MGTSTIRTADHYCESKDLPLITNRIVSEVLRPLADAGVWLAAIWLGGSLSISDTIRGARVLGSKGQKTHSSVIKGVGRRSGTENTLNRCRLRIMRKELTCA